MNQKARTMKVKTIGAATPAALDSAYETWRAARKEEVVRDVRVTGDSTMVIMQIYYTEG